MSSDLDLRTQLRQSQARDSGTRSIDKPMFLPVNDWVVAVMGRDPDTGVEVEIPLRAAQRITPGFYFRRHDESGCWLEPLGGDHG